MLQICAVLAAVFGVIMYRIIMVTLLYGSSEPIVRQNAKITTSATAALINLIVIMLLNKVSHHLKNVILPILKCCLIVNINVWYERYLFLFLVSRVICEKYLWQHYSLNHQYLTDQAMCFYLHFEAWMI